MWASTPTPECAGACGFAENPHKICNCLLQDLSDSAAPSHLHLKGEAHTGDSLGRSRAGTQHNPSAASGQMPFGCAGVAFMELRSDYFLQRQRKVTICARVQPASGLKVVAVVPAVMPFW